MTTSTNVYFWPTGVTSPLGRAIASLSNPPLSYDDIKALNPPQLWTIWSVDVSHTTRYDLGVQLIGRNKENAYNNVNGQYLGVKIATTSTLITPAITTSTIFGVMSAIPLITSEQGKLGPVYFVPNTLIGEVSGIITVTQSTGIGTAEVILTQTPMVFNASIFVP